MPLPTFIEERFPDDISYGATGGPQFNTNVVTVSSGAEVRNINWQEARAVYNVTHAVKTKAQMQNLIAFFRNVRGKAIGFRFKDWTDYTAVGEQIGTGDGVNTTFQLTKTYSVGLGTAQYVRKITKPVAGTVTVYINGVPDAGATVDTTTGIVTTSIVPAVGAIITADFEFDVPARFDIDEMQITLDHAELQSWNQITIVEIKV